MSFLNSALNNLKKEYHLPSYQFCGPGTRLKERIQRGDTGINKLDQACKEHDIAYSESTNLTERHKADEILKNKAWDRVKSSDAKLGERLSSLLVTGAMKGKLALGMGIKKKKNRSTKGRRTTYKKMVNAIQRTIKIRKPSTIGEAVSLALRRAKDFSKTKVKLPRVIPLKSGGFLPFLVPSKLNGIHFIAYHQ